MQICPLPSHPSNFSYTCLTSVCWEAASNDVSLANLTLGGTSLDEWTPCFDPAVYDYGVRIPHATVRTAVLPGRPIPPPLSRGH